MFKKTVGTAGALVMLVAAVLVVPQRGKASDIDQVLVVNGPRRPVPVNLGAGASVAITGTVNANVTNQPTVALAGGTNVGIAGTPNVNVANTPTVNLAAGSQVGLTGPVSLTPGTVVDVRTVNDVPQPVEAEVTVSIPAGQAIGNEVVVTVPAGKRFVLEDVSGLAFLPGEKLIQASVTMPNGALNSPEIDFTPTFNGPSGTIDLWAFGRTARGFADSSVIAFARRKLTVGDATVFFTVAGHFVNL